MNKNEITQLIGKFGLIRTSGEFAKSIYGTIRETDNMYNRENLKRNDGVLMRHIPARSDEDYDLLVGELLVRFNEKIKDK